MVIGRRSWSLWASCAYGVLTYGVLAHRYWTTWLWPATVDEETAGILMLVLVVEPFVFMAHLLAVPLMEEVRDGRRRAAIYLAVVAVLSLLPGGVGWTVGTHWAFVSFWVLTGVRAIELLWAWSYADKARFNAGVIGSVCLYFPCFLLADFAPKLGLVDFEPATPLFVEKLGETHKFIALGSAYFSLMVLLELAVAALSTQLVRNYKQAGGVGMRARPRA